MGVIVELTNVVKQYPLGKLTVNALNGVDLSVERGAFAVIAGPSGSGKTTLLNMIGCVDVPTSGTVSIEGCPVDKLNDRKRTRLRLRKLGFIFQSFNLIPVLSAFQNIELPLLLQGGLSKKKRGKRVEEMLSLVGLTPQARQRPNELSGGQRQRVAIARALVSHPSIVLADEPTANLDSQTGLNIIQLMKSLNEKQQTTFIFSTHDLSVMKYAERVIHIVDGNLAAESVRQRNQGAA